jgi:hypothetical protein
MIGQFTIAATVPELVTLTDDLEWEAGDPLLKQLLDDQFDPQMPPYSSPAVGAPGRLALKEAAAAFGSVPVYGPEPADEPDAIH